MNTTSTAGHRWDTSRYMRIVEAWCEGGDLLVAFEDGARVRVGIERLVPSGKRGLDWGSLRVDPYELVVPAADGDHEISWLAIRRLTDPAFEAHLARSARAPKEGSFRTRPATRAAPSKA